MLKKSILFVIVLLFTLSAAAALAAEATKLPEIAG